MSPEDENAVTFSDLMPSKEKFDLKEGTHLGRYQILGLLGKGGMGAVYKAYDPELDRSIAIKILTVKPHEGETASRPQARLMREAQALAKLSHPNVVSIFDVGTYEDSVYIAMEYVKGKTLREWIKQETPTQKEIIKVLSKAGKGLQAAHTEGIVHRDFKPENVIIGDRGQIKVLDFGLARAAGTEETVVPHEEQKTSPDPPSGEKLLSTSLTKVGAIVGTTVYMAPEHFLHQKLDEKTDQFSFCVTLFESLYGKRPFRGKNAYELEENITSGWIEIPEEANVPKWIEGILLRGISVSKGDRYASMLELLNSLDDDPEIIRAKRHKKIAIASIIMLLASMTLGFGYYAFFRSSKVCTGADKKVSVVWNDERKEKIKQEFAKTELSYADDSFVRVEKRFGEYLNKWATLYSETCEATRIRDEQPVEIMVLKMGCLDKHLMDVGALIKVFGEADKTVVEKAVQAVSSLSGFSNCNDVDALRSRIPPPKDEQTKNKVAAIREKLAEVEAFQKTGKYGEGLELVKQLATQAMLVDYRLVKAEYLYDLGVLQRVTGDYKTAEKTLYEAAQAASKSKDSLLVVKTMRELMSVVGVRQERPDAALYIAKDAELMLNVSGGDETLRAMLYGGLADLFRKKGVFDKALEYNKCALEKYEKAFGPDHYEVSTALNNIGEFYKKIGEYDNAMKYLHRSLAIDEKTLGPEHPYISWPLHNIGSVFLLRGEYQKALTYLRRAMTIYQQVVGADHPEIGTSLLTIGHVYFGQGQYNKALQYYRRAHAIYFDKLGPEHPKVAKALNNMGEVFKEQQEYDNAEEHFRKALNIWQKRLGHDHPDVSSSLIGIGDVLIAQGKLDQSLVPLERANRICQQKGCDPVYHSKGLFDLAQSLVATNGNQKRAIRLARQAKEIFERTPKAFKKELAEVDAWLKKHDGSAEETKQIRLSKSKAKSGSSNSE